MKFMKWCSIAVVVALLVVWGSQAQDWVIRPVVSGPDAARQRVLEPDVAVESDGTVYVSYIDQRENAVMLLQVKEEAVTAKTGIKRDTGRVAGTTVAVDKALVCVAWEELSDESGVHEVWQACWEKPLANDAAPKVEPRRWSTGDTTAGQANGAGWGEFSLNFDNTFAPDGTLYTVWAEDYTKLVAAKYAGGNVQLCGEFPPLPIPDAPTRYPTVYVDDAGGVWVSSADISYPPGPNIWLWYSPDKCDNWIGPVDLTPAGLYSDGVGLAHIGTKLFAIYDEDQGAAPGTADINATVCDMTPNGAANCVRQLVFTDGGFPHIATDGKGLYVIAPASATADMRFGYSCDAGATWRTAHPPSRYNSGFRDPDFGATLSRPRVATSAGTNNVYAVWLLRGEGRSNIMLAKLPKPCQ